MITITVTRLKLFKMGDVTILSIIVTTHYQSHYFDFIKKTCMILVH